jgi:Mitochondrial K+-H+ exchange-related
MDVYLTPVGPDRYECYYESADQDEPEVPVDGQGFFARLRMRFNEQLREAERARHQKSIEEPKTFLGRMHKRSMRWIAERIAEQRLLWHLRTETTATLHTPGNLADNEAESIMRATMKRDADHHRIRMILHSVALVAVVPVALVPGPNVIGYLFTFTVVGHFLAWRGAVNALHKVAWTIVPNPALTDLRRAFSLKGDARHDLIRDVAERLHLRRMARFVEQMATPT